MVTICEHCEKPHPAREGLDTTQLCDACAHLEVDRLRGVLAILNYHLGTENYIGAIAHNALQRPVKFTGC